jgi:hypothetical protein
MQDDIPTAYPLAWPKGKPRTKWDARTSGRFNRKEREYGNRGDGSSYSYTRTKDLTVTVAAQRVLDELGRLGVDYRYVPVISTNLVVNLNGLPRSGQRKPDDPGVAVYFRIDGDPVVLATDRYDSVEGNLAAIAAHIAASRAIERHGVGTLKEIFRGFAALPPGIAPEPPWDDTLGYPTTLEDAEKAYRVLAFRWHPDRQGGDETKMQRANAAIAKAREVLHHANP